MQKQITAPYGTWKSPITAKMLTTGAKVFDQMILDGDTLFWIESRPEEGGRYVIVQRTPDGKISDLLPAPFNARTRVHEYGGGSMVVDAGTVYFSNYSDQRLYVIRPGQSPVPLTTPSPLRFADGVIDERRRRLICVCEDHTDPRPSAVVNRIVAIPLDFEGEVSPEAMTILASGYDFYSYPRLSPDGNRLAWTCWNHPNMPWDGTELWVAGFDSAGHLLNPQLVAGGVTESIFQPAWSPDNHLYFVSDRQNWWQIYRWDEPGTTRLTSEEVEFGLPQWTFGQSTYGFASPEVIYAYYLHNGDMNLARIDIAGTHVTPLDTAYTFIQNLVVAKDRLYFYGASPSQPVALVELLLPGLDTREYARATEMVIDPGYISSPVSIRFPTEGGRTAQAFYYPPKNAEYKAPAGEKPPMIVMSHGGPTSATYSRFSLLNQYWTSRGFAVLDVNYGGSTGFGREYRDRLKGTWGITDIDDCVNAAKFMVAQGKADKNRLAIRGGSAGGYTTLASLTFRDVFKAGASLFGVSDMEGLALDTHKFESHYLDLIVGLYPQMRDIYLERSPIHHVDRLNCPVIFFQGLEDKIVPPDQAERMVDALRKKGIPVAYLPFEGEQHGFRKAENIIRSLEAEYYFYAKIFGFEPADPIPPVVIENLRA